MIPRPNLANPYAQSMRFIFFCLVFVFVLMTKSTAQTPFTCQDQFFLTLLLPPATLNEVVINGQNNVEFKQIKANLGLEVNAAGYRSTDNFIYCIEPENRRLVRLDAVGNAQVLATLPLDPMLAYFAGDITPDGRFLVVVGTATLISGSRFAAEIARIDLESPTYATTRVLMNTSALIFDVAFSPITGQLYGYDSNGLRLVRIDWQTGAVTFPYPSAGVPGVTGSMFFDAFGRLFVYGSSSPFSDDQNSLYELDTQTGASRLLTTGDVATASDGCSCPYTVQLTKTVNRPETLPCTEVEYTFTIANTSGRPQQGLLLDDPLPSGFTFVRVQSNPLGGTVDSPTGSNRFTISSLTVPVGNHEIKIIVNVGPSAPGIYRNQAVLRNLPVSLGQSRLSDDPATLIKGDSTTLRIVSLPFLNVQADTTLCAGKVSVRLDASRYATALGTDQVTYLWSDGSTAPTFDALSGGTYQAAIAVGCDTVFVEYQVREAGINVILAEDYFRIPLGDSLLLEGTAFNTNAQQIVYQWLDPQPGSVRCDDCASTWAQPFNDLRYILLAQNEWGCQDTAGAQVEVLKNRNIYFPNVIKPEGSLEPINAYFFPSGDPSATIQYLAVYSRWGELMFDTRNIPMNSPESGWDGTFRSEAVMPGVYVWQAKIKFLDGAEVFASGDVAVVR